MKLEEKRPGVHVKGDVQTPYNGKSFKEHSDVSDADDIEEDEPIQIKIRSKEEVAAPKVVEPSQASPISLALASLVHEKGIQASRRDSASSSILAQLLNSPSASTPGKSSVGQVLAQVLHRASDEASTKEPKRAASLRNLANYFSEKERSGKTDPEAIPEDESPPISPPSDPTYNPMVLPGTTLGGGIFSRMLVGSSVMGVGIPTPRPIATVAGSTSTTTTSSSTALLSQTGFSRTSSGTNLKSIDIS